MDCLVTFWGEYAVTTTHALPTLITSILVFASWITRDILFVVVGLYLQAWQFLLWIIQLYVQSKHPNEVCNELYMYTFPNIESFYASAIVSMWIAYAITYHQKGTWDAWLYAAALFFLPPLIIVWFGAARVWETAVSLVIGVAAAGVFFALMYGWGRRGFQVMCQDGVCKDWKYTSAYFI